ncbi:hypothetical protein SLAV_37140 [Streptomyces lavendulae subsp. lavendulae]|uniref:Uncharacterized protein n=1 Tax=Streptomyces lavendulae subsp. lavendulae TaxID=58340 RepID=A0A2K8PTM8_STRLA|nr:hypothetical protein SLAV_37140 [Streptomyces lavendulae subsp. lavendulae]QUQ59009.1 hypothetical protein SLLC_35300 [Streptomyces lavendulae subsp. lavendulae]
MGERLVEEISTALDEQTVTLPATETGVGVRTGARTPIEVGDGVGVGDGSAFPTTAHLAAQPLRVVADAATRAGRGQQADVYTQVEMASATGWACPAGGRSPRYALRRHPARRVATMCLASAWS